MNALTQWVRQNKILASILVIVVIYIWFSGGLRSSLRSANLSMTAMDKGASSMGYAPEMAMMSAPSPVARDGIMPPVYSEDSVALNPGDRKVVTESYFSALVSDVNQTVNLIQTRVQEVGGFVVNSSVNHPSEASTGTIVVRVPKDQVEAVTQALREDAVKITMETVTGYDVTDQYTDYQARLETLEATLAKFQVIFDQATRIQDILEVQRAIIQVQDQIDQITGQLQRLEELSQSSKITINLSTDELALPYAPDDAWRPQLVFKTAVRNLISNIRDLGSALIWLGVYAVVWVPGLVIAFVVYTKLKTNKP